MNLSTTIVFLFLLLHHFFHATGVSGTKFTIVNSCSEAVWPVVRDKSTNATAEYELPSGSSLAFQRSNGWNGRVWGKTGCIFNDSGMASCATGDTLATLAEFGLRSSLPSSDFYDVSLVDGFNLPLVVKPSAGSCESVGCTADLIQICPPELRSTDGGAVCRGPCSVFRTPEYCCTEGPQSCGPTDYSSVFKKACPRAYSYPMDDATSLFSCTANSSDYSITFCPPHNYSLSGMPPAPSPGYNNPQQRKGILPPAPSPQQTRLGTTPPALSPSYNPQQRKGKNNIIHKIIIAIGSIIGAFLVSIVICCCFLKRRRSQNSPKRKRNQDVENILLQNGALAPKRYRYSEIKKITKSLSDKLGQGGYGSVYKGVLPDGRLVAVKILFETTTDHSNGEEFINEVVSISRTSHVNIVALLGFCYEGSKRALVYEFMPNESLDKFLRGNLDSQKLYEIAVGVAKGLEYLHTGCNTRIVHFDIKPENILLDQDLCPKISDFGLAKICKKKQSIISSLMGMRGTVGYIAPEVFLRDFGGISHKSDVYSYGMMVLEMAGAKTIVDNNGGTSTTANGMQSSDENYFPDKIYEKIIYGVDEIEDDELAMEEGRKKMFLVGFWCIQTSPLERPSISKVVEMLEGSVESIQVPPKPVLFHRPLNPDQEPSLSWSSSSTMHVETEINSAQD